MSIEEKLVKKKLKKRFPDEETVEQIEKELYPLQGDEILPKVGKKKKKNTTDALRG